jgi:hypothetical protein
MKKKVLISIITIIAVALVATPVIGSVLAGRGTNKRTFVTYELKATVDTPEITYTDTSGAPNLIILEGYRPDASKLDINVTINGVLYSYPEDINYEETFRMEFSAITNEGVIIPETVLTFVNLPGKPQIIDFAIGKMTGINTPDQQSEGTVSLAGTKIFSKVEGNGWEKGYRLPSEAYYTHHLAAIKGWCFGSVNDD